MGAKIADLRDAVVTFINGESYSQSFTATAANVPTLELEDTSDVVVTVFPGEFTATDVSRAGWDYEYNIYVAVQKVITASDRLAEEDEMLLLTEEIEDSLKDEAMGSMSMLSLAGNAGPRSPFMSEQLVAAGHFVSVLEVTYYSG